MIDEHLSRIIAAALAVQSNVRPISSACSQTRPHGFRKQKKRPACITSAFCSTFHSQHRSLLHWCSHARVLAMSAPLVQVVTKGVKLIV